MTALASTDDYEVLTASTSTDQIERMLDIASAFVRRRTGQFIELVEDDEITVTPTNGVARLPQRPVIDVSSVVRNGVELDPLTYTWTRQGILRGPDNLLRFDLDLVWGCLPLTVTYTHGWESIPDDIIGVIVGMVGRKVQGAGNIRQETIDGYSVTFSTSDLTDQDSEILAGLGTVVGRIDTYPSWA